MNTHLIVEKFERYTKVTCPEGHFITDWDKQDIFYFTDARIMFCPVGYDLSKYYCITEDEHNEYLKQLEEAARNRAEEENKRLNEME